MTLIRAFLVATIFVSINACANGDPDSGVAVERVVSGDWEDRFADDPSAHLVSLPPGRSYFDAWVYQFGASPSEWLTHNMECGPASVSILERLSGAEGTTCAYLASIPGCPPTVHSACRQTGVCGRSSGFAANSGIGTSVYQLRDVLTGLGYGARVFSGSGDNRMTFTAVRNAIDADHPLIVSVDACEYADELALGVCSHSHFMVVYGYSSRYVYILDPGYRNGQRGRITIDAFNRAIAPDPTGVEVTRPGFDQHPNATWYPPGSLLETGGEYYYVVLPDPSGVPRAWHASPAALAANRIPIERAISVAREVVGCFSVLGELDPTPHFREYRDDATGEIFLVDLATRERFVYLNWAAYVSHNGRDEWRSATAGERDTWSRWPLRGSFGLAPGVLVASDDPSVSTVWVVSYNERGRLRLPIFNERTARIYGYDVSAIGDDFRRSVRVVSHDLNLLAGIEGELIREELARDCGDEHCLTADACFIHAEPGGTGEATGSESGEVPMSPDAGFVPVPDAGIPGADAGSVSVDPERLRVALPAWMQIECPGGYVIEVWGSSPSAIRSSTGEQLDVPVPDWSGWSALTLACPSNSRWRDWSSWAGRTVLEAGFEELSIDGSDIRSSTLICIEPWNPSAGYRPVIAWDPARRGSCP